MRLRWYAARPPICHSQHLLPQRALDRTGRAEDRGYAGVRADLERGSVAGRGVVAGPLKEELCRGEEEAAAWAGGGARLGLLLLLPPPPPPPRAEGRRRIN